MIETPESINALRRYYDGHRKARAAVTANGFAEAMAQANKADAELYLLSLSAPYEEVEPS